MIVVQLFALSGLLAGARFDSHFVSYRQQHWVEPGVEQTIHLLISS